MLKDVRVFHRKSDPTKNSSELIQIDIELDIKGEVHVHRQVFTVRESPQHTANRLQTLAARLRGDLTVPAFEQGES